MSTAATLIFQRLIADAAARKASDVHLSPGSVPMFRIAGQLITAGEAVIDPETVDSILAEILDESGRAELAKKGSLTRAFDLLNQVRAKVVVRSERGVHSLAVRIVPLTIPTVAELGLPPPVAHLMDSRRGLIIISGPFDAGKTTTQAAFLNTLNAQSRRFVVTLEDPIEYLLAPKESIIEQREVGRDVPDVATGLQEILPEDVEVVGVSALPDGASVKAALELVSSGRLVLVQIEAANIVQVFTSLLGHLPGEARAGARALLADSLVALVHQKLVLKIQGGRRIVFDLLLPTTAARSAIREDRLTLLPNIIATARAEGMVSLDHMLEVAVAAGEVKLEDALTVANDPQALRTSLRR